jgi:N-methylhydantoinase A/oxoprolinase/acetone carboxylase beta subunit
MAGSARVGVDIGGTFTDIVVRRPGERSLILKVPTTRSDPSVAVLEALARIAQERDIPLNAIDRFIHGTTVATNAVLERKGAQVGLLTTEGFADVLEIGRQMRRQMYDLALVPETPVFLAPGRFRQEVRERIGPQGEVIVPLDDASVLAAAENAVRAGATAFAICFLFSFLNDAHEKRARDLVKARFPHLEISLSSEVDPAFREYERTVVTTFDAYVKPVVDRYLANLEHGLASAGVDAPLQVMQSRGGVAGADLARKRPVRLFLSGPAAGVIGARMAAETAGFRDVVTVDVGGTSSDIALIEDGRPALKSEGTIEGYPVRVSMVDVNTIGAGGGSLAWIDGAGGLRVGPASAGSEPGPACYGRGGTQATVTDASVVLGYLDPASFAGGSMRLHADKALAAIRDTIASPLGLSPEEAALGIHRVVNSHMAEGIRLVSIRQGHDPRRFALLPLGGAGPLHACPLAEDLGMTRIVVPRHPGVLSAAGLLAAPIEHEAAAAFPFALANADPDRMRATLATIDKACAERMAAESIGDAPVLIRRFADVCYVGQAYTLEIELHPDTPDSLERLKADFYAAHDRIYGYAPQVPVKLVNLRSVHAVAGLAGIDDGAWEPSSGPIEKRPVVIRVGDGRTVNARVLDRTAMPAGFAFEGPAVIEQPDTTTLVTPGWRGRIDAAGIMILERD